MPRFCSRERAFSQKSPEPQGGLQPHSGGTPFAQHPWDEIWGLRSCLPALAPGSHLPLSPRSTFVPSLVCWINRFFFWLLFSSRVENVAVSYKIFNYECRFKQHVQDWAIPM